MSCHADTHANMQPFSVQRIDHIVLRVRDLPATVAFYKAVLGCSVARDRPELGLIHLTAGASMIDLVSVGGKLGRVGGVAAGQEGRNVDHICLRVEPFNETELVAHLARFGVNPRDKASSNFGAEGEGLSLYFEDPEGNVIELKGPPSLARSDA